MNVTRNDLLASAACVCACLSLLLVGCSQNTGSIANQDVSNSRIDGGLANKAVTGPTGPITTNLDFRIALDPNSFSSIFGNASTAIKPSPAQLEDLKDLASEIPDQEKSAEIIRFVGDCEQQGADCIVTKDSGP